MSVDGAECCSASNWMHYPDVSQRAVPAGQMRLHAHADGGSLVTLLFQIAGELLHMSDAPQPRCSPGVRMLCLSSIYVPIQRKIPAC